MPPLIVVVPRCNMKAKMECNYRHALWDDTAKASPFCQRRDVDTEASVTLGSMTYAYKLASVCMDNASVPIMKGATCTLN